MFNLILALFIMLYCSSFLSLFVLRRRNKNKTKIKMKMKNLRSLSLSGHGYFKPNWIDERLSFRKILWIKRNFIESSLKLKTHQDSKLSKLHLTATTVTNNKKSIDYNPALKRLQLTFCQTHFLFVSFATRKFSYTKIKLNFTKSFYKSFYEGHIIFLLSFELHTRFFFISQMTVQGLMTEKCP